MFDRDPSRSSLQAQAHGATFAKTSTLRIFRWAQGTSIAIAVFLGAFIVTDNRHQRSAVAAEVRKQNRLKLEAARTQIENYIREVQLCLDLISVDPHVKAFDRLSESFVQALYEANHDRHRVSEIYIIERDFDGTRKPFKSLECGDDEHEKDELHSLEREAAEYLVQVEHIRRFIASPDLGFQISEEVPLCVGESGLILSSPIRSEGDTVGIVAGMILSRTIASVLEESSLHNMVLLASSQGSVFTCSDFSESAESWFATQLAREGVSSFFDARENGFRVDRYTALWTDADIPGEAQWYVSFIYDEAAALKASGVTSAWAGWGAAAVVLLLGGAVVFVCRATVALLVARHQSETRRLALDESRALTRAALDGIITIGERGVVESVNAAVCHIFGYSADQIIGRNVKMLMPSPYREKHDENLAVYLRTGRKKIMGTMREIVGRRNDGTTFPIEIAVSEVRLPGKRLFTGIVRDITDRKRAQQALRESEERLTAILDNTSRVVCLTDSEGNYLLINRQFERIFHVSRSDAIGRAAADVLPRALVEQVREHEQRVLKQRTPVESEYTIHLDDGLHIFSSIKFPLLDNDGDVYAVCDISADITDRKRAEKLAQERQEELAHVTRLATMGEMAAGLAHELNQPLAAVITYLQACRERIRGPQIDPDRLLEDLDRAIAQSHQAGEIIHHVRQFMRKSDVQRKPIDLNALVRETVGLVEHLTTGGRIDVRLNLAEDIPLVIVERIQIQQAMLNLMKNAIEAMTDNPETGRRLVVSTSFNDRREVELAIQDEGTGLKGAILRRVFDPYYSTKPNGMGLGLSISRSIIEKHAGRLWAEPSDGGGAVFRFTLPLDSEGLTE